MHGRTVDTSSMLNDLCRCCASTHDYKVDVFNSICSNDRAFCEVLEEWTSVQISPDDGLSSYICYSCVLNVESFVTFRKKCVESASIMKKIYDDIKEEEAAHDRTASPRPGTSADVRAFYCAHCDGQYRTENELERHVRRHADHLLYKCELCNERFVLKSKFVEHRSVHASVETTKIGPDSEETVADDGTGRETIRTERARPHDENRKPYECGLCGKSFELNSLFRKHKRNHTVPFKSATSKYRSLLKKSFRPTRHKACGCKFCSKILAESGAEESCGRSSEHGPADGRSDADPPEDVPASRVDRIQIVNVFSLKRSDRTDRQTTCPGGSDEVRDSRPDGARDPRPDEARDPRPDEARDPRPDEARDPRPDEARDPRPDEARDPRPDEARVLRPDEVRDPRPEEVGDTRPDDVRDPWPDEVRDSRPDNVRNLRPYKVRILRRNKVRILRPNKVRILRRNKVRIPRPGEVRDPRPDEVRDSWPDKVRDIQPDEVRDPRPDEVQNPRPDEVQNPRPDEVQNPRPDEVQNPRPDEVQNPRPDEVQNSRPDEVPNPRPDVVRDQRPDEVKDRRPDEESVSEMARMLNIIGVENAHQLVVNDDECVHFENETVSFRCELCGEEYSSESLLEDHVVDYHENRPLHRCDVCGDVFILRTDFAKHRSFHSNETKRRKRPGRPCRLPYRASYDCGVCGKSFRFKSVLDRHRGCHEKFSCDVCGRKFRKRKYFLAHETRHSKDSVRPCRDLEVRLGPIDRGKIVDGTKRSHGPAEERDGDRVVDREPRVDATDSVSERENGGLLVARRSRKKRKKYYPCDSCPRWFVKRKFYDAHVRTHAPTDDRVEPNDARAIRNPTYDREPCGESFRYTYVLELHVDDHERDGAFGRRSSADDLDFGSTDIRKIIGIDRSD